MNHQLIKVTVKNNQQVVSARDLHNELQLKKTVQRLGSSKF